MDTNEGRFWANPAARTGGILWTQPIWDAYQDPAFASLDRAALEAAAQARISPKEATEIDLFRKIIGETCPHLVKKYGALVLDCDLTTAERAELVHARAVFTESITRSMRKGLRPCEFCAIPPKKELCCSRWTQDNEEDALSNPTDEVNREAFRTWFTHACDAIMAACHSAAKSDSPSPNLKGNFLVITVKRDPAQADPSLGYTVETVRFMAERDIWTRFPRARFYVAQCYIVNMRESAHEVVAPTAKGVAQIFVIATWTSPSGQNEFMYPQWKLFWRK
ncbi:hypothetical protein RQP46_002368 [Phenoliferia psychrophenolica]